MRVFTAAFAATLLTAGAALAQPAAQNQTSNQQIACSQISDAQHFVDGLKPGPNTRAAQQHLDSAKAASQARNDRQCVSELGRVNYYAKRSAAADKRAATRHQVSAHSRVRHVQCADATHQNRPGGTDYHGPAVPGCKTPAL
ncbi:MAG TPA: hypothetical protein VGL83_01295 [Stellaceae bacterium]|jgi:hypothetical protein